MEYGIEKCTIRIMRSEKRQITEGGDTCCNWCTCNGLKMLFKQDGRVGNRRMSRDYPSPGDFSRLAVAQTPVKDHQLSLV